MYEFTVFVYMALNFKKPICTRNNHKVRIYFIYKDYMHGAYYDEKRDWWNIGTWTLAGYYFGKQHKDELDLVNVLD